MGARPAYLTISNFTGNTLSKGSDDVEHGKYVKNPPDKVVRSEEFEVSAKDGALIGPKGWVEYAVEGTSVVYRLFWNHPYGSATSAYTVEIKNDEREEYHYKINGDPERHEQHMDYELYK